MKCFFEKYISNPIKKYCYISIPIITILFLYIANRNNICKLPDEQEIQEYLATVVGISGSLVGFLFTAMTIFFSLNKDSKYMKNFKKYNHHFIFSRLVTFGIITLCLNIILWLFNANKYITVLSFIVGLEESLMSAYYIYKLALNSFK